MKPRAVWPQRHGGHGVGAKHFRKKCFAPTFFYSTRALVVVAVLCLVIGCSLPTMHYYRVSLNVAHQETDAPNGAVIKVEKFKVQGVLDQDRIVYHNSPYEVAYYNYHRWATPLDVMVTEAVQARLAASAGMRVAKSNASSDHKESFRLEGEVISFEEIDEGKDWYANVSMMVTLRDASGTPLWSERLEARHKVQARNPTMVVEALSQALSDCLDEMLEEILPLTKAN